MGSGGSVELAEPHPNDGMVPSSSSCSHGCVISVQHTPLPSHHNVKRYVSMCQKDWKKIVEHRITGGGEVRTGISIFCSGVSRYLSSHPLAEPLTTKLSYGWQQRRVEIVFVALKFALGMNNVSEKDLGRKLKVLGREHTRLNIDAELLYAFSDGIVNSIFEFFGQNAMANAHVFDKIPIWAGLFRYIVDAMTSEKVKFYRFNSSSDFVSDRGETQVSVSHDPGRRESSYSMLPDESAIVDFVEDGDQIPNNESHKDTDS